MIETKYRTCNLCEALCGLAIEVENNKVLTIKGDKKDVFSRGHICPKAVALKDLHEDPDRLKFPVKKVNGDWEEISWEEAFDTVARRLYEIQQHNGANSVAIYQGNPSVHNLGTSLFSPGFVRLLQTKNRYSATSVDQLGHHLAGEYMFGHMSLVPVPDIIRTDYWLILGGNPLVSNGSLMTAPNVAGKLKDIQKRKGKVVVIDPRRTETAKKADQHLFVRPGTDIWLLLAMIKLILEEDLVKLGHIKPFIASAQLDLLKDLLSELSITEVAGITGIKVESIINLTREFTLANSAVIYGRLGVSANKYGGLCHWAINTINILTNNFDKAGGAMLTNPAVELGKSRPGKKRFRRWKSRVRGLPEFGGELPSSTLAEDMLTPGEGQIKALVTSCGNPVLSVPNGRKLDEAFESLEFYVAIDIYINESTRHADIILPPATGLETPHYGIAFHNLAVHNTAKYSNSSVDKEPGTKYDWEIFSELGAAYEKCVKGPDFESTKYTLTDVFDSLLISGKSGLTLEKLRQHPHGIDLGPLKSVIPNRLKTEDGMINIVPDIYISALKDLLIQKVDAKGLLLIGRRALRSNNSWLHNSYRMVKGPNKCTMLIHPSDAEQRNILNGETVIVQSRVGAEEIEAELSSDMMPGSVSIPHGWGHHRPGIKLKIASVHAGISINDLIDEQVVDALSGVSVINGVPVEVSKKN